MTRRPERCSGTSVALLVRDAATVSTQGRRSHLLSGFKGHITAVQPFKMCVDVVWDRPDPPHFARPLVYSSPRARSARVIWLTGAVPERRRNRQIGVVRLRLGVQQVVVFSSGARLEIVTVGEPLRRHDAEHLPATLAPHPPNQPVPPTRGRAFIFSSASFLKRSFLIA